MKTRRITDGKAIEALELIGERAGLPATTLAFLLRVQLAPFKGWLGFAVDEGWIRAEPKGKHVSYRLTSAGEQSLRESRQDARGTGNPTAPVAVSETIASQRQSLAANGQDLCGRCLSAAAVPGRWLCGACKDGVSTKFGDSLDARYEDGVRIEATGMS